MKPVVEVHPVPARRRDFARWATAQRPKVRTISAHAFAVPAGLLSIVPEELLTGSMVDGHRYVSPTDDTVHGAAPPGASEPGAAEPKPLGPRPSPAPMGGTDVAPPADPLESEGRAATGSVPGTTGAGCARADSAQIEAGPLPAAKPTRRRK